MRTIFKTQLKVCDQQTVQLPRGFKILDIDRQGGMPCILYECDSEYEKVDVNNIGMSDEDKAKLDATVTVMFMCCDLIETAVAEGDELLHKYDETLRLNLFDDINKIVEAAKQKRRMLNSHSIVPHDDIWGDKCDDMYEMMYNKAKAILKHFDK